MPVLAGVILAALGSLYSFFRKTVGTWAIFAVAITLMIGGFLVVKGVVVALIATVASAVPSVVVMVCTWFVPYNLDDCIGIRVAAELAFAVYRWQYNITLAGAQAAAA